MKAETRAEVMSETVFRPAPGCTVDDILNSITYDPEKWEQIVEEDCVIMRTRNWHG